MGERALSRREFLKGAAGVGLGAAGVVLGACAAPATPPPATSGPAPVAAAPTTAPAPPAAVTLVYWAEPRFQNVPGKEAQTKEIGNYERLLSTNYMANNKSVTVKADALAWEDLATKVATAIAAGTPPDLLKDYLGRTSSYAYQNLLEPLETALPKEELADYLPSLVQLYTIKGHLSGLPIYYWLEGMVINNAIVKSANATDMGPAADGTWDIAKFEQMLKALAIKDKRWPLGVQVSSEQGDYANLGFFWANGAVFYKNGDYSKTYFNSPEAVDTLTKFVNWYKAGYIEPGVATLANTDLDNMLFQGQVVMEGNGPGYILVLDTAKSQNKVTADWEPAFSLYPNKPGSPSGGMAAGPTSVVIFKQTDAAKRTAAINFARFLVGPDLQKEYSVVSQQYPTRTSVGDPFAGQTDPTSKALSAFTAWAQKFGVADMGLASPAYAEVRVQLPPQLQAAFLGKKTPQQALADYETAANQILAKYKS